MMTSTAATPFVLQACALAKAFGAVPALRGVSLDVVWGEVHAVMGENGAGKSTLMKLLAGHFPPEAGEIRIGGQAVRLRNPHEALARGIVMIHQELWGFPELSVAANIHMGREPTTRFPGWLDHGRIRREAASLLGRLGLNVPPDCPLRELSVAERQMVEIAKALARQARVVIMDEPTSALSEPEANALFAIIDDLRRAGVAVLYITHRLEEVQRIADRVTVLRDGAHVATVPAAGLTASRLVELMVGRATPINVSRIGTSTGELALEVCGLGRRGGFRDVSFTVRQGEVVGLAGLMGAGRTEVASAIYGLAPADEGEVRVFGRPARLKHPRDALALGIAMVTEDRRESGLVPQLALPENMTLASLRQFCRGPFIDHAREARIATEQVSAFAIKEAGLRQPVNRLSGGNQQKVLLARALLTRPRILILDEPTRGIDVAAKAEIYALIRRLATEGLVVLLVSSELPEVLALSDRVLVMREGRLAAELDPRVASAAEVLHLAMPD